MTCSSSRCNIAANLPTRTPRPSEREVPRLLVKTRNIPADEKRRAEWVDSYSVDAIGVAEALLDRIETLADERARFRRSLMYSVEVIESPDFDVTACRDS